MRTFKAKDRFGNETEFELVASTQSVETKGEMEYRKAYNIALAEGLMPRDKMRSVMKEHGIWTDDDDTELTKLMKLIGNQEVKLSRFRTEGNQDKCAIVAKNLLSNRRKMMELINIQSSAYSNSCEGMAEAIRIEALMAFCVKVKATDQPYWESYSDYVSERDENTDADVVSKVIDVQVSLRAESYKETLNSFPEHEWLSEARDALIKQSAASAAKILAERKKKASGKPVSRRPKRRKKTNKKPATKRLEA